jgi:NAD(P)-dependent dehydrogenase (short-subunit alcohol dehydrogenase family)
MTRSMKQPDVVVITGASAGVGRATARLFAARGARIGLLARGIDGLQATREEVEALGGTAVAMSVDVSSAEQVEQAADAIEASLGPIDIWINNAMVSVFSPVAEMYADEYRRVTEVTYLGIVYGTLAALRRMRRRDRGTIVQVGSALAYRGIPLQSAYCGAKHAVQGFTESLRCELLHDCSNVRVTMVQLPALNTPQFGWVRSRLPRKPQPVPPIYQPEVAARAIVWSAYHDRRELNVGLPTVLTVQGSKLAAGLGDWYLAWKGFESQQTDQPAERERRDNLWQPIPGDHGAHGDFDTRATDSSPLLWAATHRSTLIALGGVLMAGILARRL